MNIIHKETRMSRILLYCSVIWAGACAFSCSQAPTEAPSFESLPKLDVHAHYYENVPGLAEMLRSINMETINICTRGNDPEMVRRMEAFAEKQFKEYGGTFRFASTFELTKRYEPDWTESVKEWLARSYENGAVMTKIWKEIGMEFKTPEGKWLMPDDPIFDPIYDFIAESNKPLIAHLAEPLAAWLPLNPESPHYGYYSNNPEWHFYQKEGVPQHAEIIAARDHILEKHPDLVFIGAHLGSQAHDVDEVAVRLDKFPNYYVETAARIADLTRQPKEKVRSFLIKYQDRVMYGTDLSSRPQQANLSDEERAAFLKGIENTYRRDFQYFAGTGTMTYAGKEIECLELPLEVLKKFYKGNAERVILKK